MGRNDELDALIARAQNGDVRAFETLISEHQAQVRRFARAFAQGADADDLAQEALIKVYQRLRQFRYQSSFSTWLFSVVRNACLDHVKSAAARGRKQETSLGPAEGERADEAISAEGRLAQEDERRRLWAALSQLPVEFRTVVVLFDVEGHSYDEVAAIEDVRVGTVKSRLHRGRALLRKILGEPEPSDASEEGAGTSEPQNSSHLRRSGP